MSATLTELQSDLLCHITDDGGLLLNKDETHDLFMRLADIRETQERLRDIVSKPLVSLIDDFQMIQLLRKADGE